MKKTNKKSKAMVLIGIMFVILIIAAIVIVCVVLPKNDKPANKSTENLSKEEMIELAKDYTGTDETGSNRTNLYFLQLAEDMSNADAQKGNIYKVEGTVDNIADDYCDFNYGVVRVRIYLPSDTIANFKEQETEISVVGKFEDIKFEEEMMSEIAHSDIAVFELKNCYLIEE